MISTRFIALLVLAASLPLSESKLPDGWSIHITDPDSDTVWLGGSQETVRWEVQLPSTGRDDYKGDIYLANADGITDWKHHLAANFNLTAREAEVTVPNVPVNQYKVVLFSESTTVGHSNKFTIAKT